MRRLTCLLLGGVLLGCPPGGGESAIGTLRGNQRVLFNGAGWADPVCGPAETETQSPINCCTRNDRLICPEFTDYDIVDVEVKGSRVAVLFQVNGGNTLLLSDDSGETWRQVGVGSVGGIPTTQSMALLLSGDEVYLMVQQQEPVPLGVRTTVRPFQVDLASGRTAAVGDVALLTRPFAFAAADGTTTGVLMTPEDARNAGGPCVALMEKWRPGGAVQRQQVLSNFTGCGIEMTVLEADNDRFFPLMMADGARSCVLQHDAASNSLGGNCVSWGEWPAARAANFTDGSYANERSRRLGLFELDGNAWASPVASTEWISLGAGKPGRNGTLAGRQRYPGLVPIEGQRFVRVNRDGTVEEAVFPTSPCEGNRASCFDPGNAATWHGVVGDVLWLEPLGGEQYLVFYAHDRVAGMASYQPQFTASKETLSWKRVAPLPKPSVIGPAGFPEAQPAGAIEKYCLLRAGCGAAVDLYQCVGGLMTQTALQPGFESLMAELATTASCQSPLLDPAYFDCKLRGGLPGVYDGGVGSECAFGVDLAGSQCNSCTGNVLLTCPGFPMPAKAVNCAAGGLGCAPGKCVPSSPCTEGAAACVGDVGVRCYQGQESRSRCDLLNMACNMTQAVPAWSPCIGKGNWSPSTTNKPLRCEGPYVMWHLNGDKWADCRELGFSGCAGGRCVP